MSIENKTEELLGKLVIFIIVSFLFSTYSSWSDSTVYRLLNYDARAAEDVGIFTRILCMFAGTAFGTFLGICAYFAKFILVSITQFSEKSSSYVILGWCFIIIGVVGGANLGVKYILLWMA